MKTDNGVDLTVHFVTYPVYANTLKQSNESHYDASYVQVRFTYPPHPFSILVTSDPLKPLNYCQPKEATVTAVLHCLFKHSNQLWVFNPYLGNCIRQATVYRYKIQNLDRCTDTCWKPGFQILICCQTK